MLLAQNYQQQQQQLPSHHHQLQLQQPNVPPFHHFSQQQKQQTSSSSNPRQYQTHPQQQQQQQQLLRRLPHNLSTTTAASANFYPQSLDGDNLLDIDIEGDNSRSSSPNSSQSLLPQYSLSSFDSAPSIAIPRQTTEHVGALFNLPQSSSQTTSAFDDSSLLSAADLMQSEAWIHNGQLTPKSVSRVSHQRESSLSSLGSAGPASPYSHNTSNPHIAVTDSMSDAYHGLPTHDDSYYQLSKGLNSSGHENFYSHYPNYNADSASAAAYNSMMASHRQKADRGLLPPADYPIGSNRSRPVSVASSIASDSPATPAGEPEDDRRRKPGEDPEIFDSSLDSYSLFFDDAAFSAVPKLDRTMTDIYSDELFNPNFTITSASPSQQAQISVSPSNEVFAQRLHAANNQHLSAHSPVSTTPRDRSPFRQGSPLAPTPSHDFGSAGRMGFASAQQLREQRKAEHDAEVLRQQISHVTDAGTPQTISPKDAILEFHEQDGENNFPLFPAHDSTAFDGDHLVKAAANAVQANTQFNDMSLGGAPFNNYLQSQLPTGLQIPQHYPFVAQPRQQSSSTSMGSASMGVPSRVSSTESGTPDSMLSASPQRPAGTNADSGTYTCTYHGCTLRFETPALLQKHKREGHRQTHGLNPVRRVDTGMTSSLLNSQAGPHRCDRINPSTGKSCNTVFSRPYDLTRHEDTIHNARKQKVRCDLCTEEKTFSRADALTRHYRVCHPDVEFPGKHRRRGPSSG